MTEWQTIYGGQTSTPAEFDTTSSKFYVYQRRNIQRVGDSWQYEERKLSHGEYEKLLADENTNLQLALTELYENLLEG